MDLNRWLDSIDVDNVNPQIEAVIYVSEAGVWEIRESVTTHTEIIQVIRGSFSYHLDGLHYIASEGEVLLIPSGCLRSASSTTEQPSACYVTYARFPGVSGTEIPLHSPVLYRTGLDETLLRLYAELNLEWARRTPGYSVKCRALLLLVLHRYISLLVHRQPSGSQDPRVDESVSYIVRNYSQPLRVSDLSELSGLNPVYFGTLFKNSTGLSIKAFINRVRINNAETLIAGSGFSVEEAARRCGFDDVFYFSKVFKKQRGYPPSQARPRKNHAGSAREPRP